MKKSVIPLFNYSVIIFRMKLKICFLITFCCAVLKVFAQYEFLQMPAVDGEIQTAPTFNSCSYYYRSSGDAAFRVEYKRSNETDWNAAHTPVCDQPEKIYKGSLFHLIEDTDYQIRIVGEKDSKVIVQTAFRTWTSAPPVAKVIDLSTMPVTAQDGIVIAEQGAPDAWIKYTAPAGWTVKRTYRDADTQDATIILNGAKYIILENLAVEEGKRHAILVEDCDYVRILNCDLSGWGRTGVQQFRNNGGTGQYRDVNGRVINLDGAIQIRKSFGTVVERCYVHDPRGRANAWTFWHPAGPAAIVADHTRGGNVIRWNDFVGSDEHRWNDVIEGLENDTPDGGLFRDSDIIGNYHAFGNDDGIELEGGGMNLRFIGNKIEGTLCGISFGACMLGPQFAIGNLIVNLGDEEGLALMYFKNGHGTAQKGQRYIYNNTLHGNDRSAGAYNPYGNATPVNAGLGTMRNNIFVCNESRTPTEWARAENFDNDLFWVNRSFSATERFVATFHNYGQEKNALIGAPQFMDPDAGDFRLAPVSAARGKAVAVNGITKEGDDLGVFFNGVTDIPLRPLALNALPAQVNFNAIGGTDVVTLRLPANAPSPVTFHIRQNTVFDWFAVTPDHGALSPGESLQLTITADPAKLTGRPVFRGAFLVRTPDGLSRPVTVYAKGVYSVEKRPEAAGPNTVYINATDGATGTQINIPKEGDYSLLVRVSNRIPSRGSPRFDIAINGLADTAAVYSNYQWNIGKGDERVVWLYALGRLKAGSHNLSVKTANTDMRIVEYIVSDNPAAFFLQERNARR